MWAAGDTGEGIAILLDPVRRKPVDDEDPVLQNQSMDRLWVGRGKEAEG